MDRDRGRERRSVHLRLPPYQFLDLDLLNHRDEGVDEVIEMKDPKEFKIRGLSDRIARGLGMDDLGDLTAVSTDRQLPAHGHEENADLGISSLHTKGDLDPYERSEDVTGSEATVPSSQRDELSTPPIVFNRTYEPGGLTMDSPRHHRSRSGAEAMLQDDREIPSHSDIQVDVDLSSIHPQRRQQLFRVNEYAHSNHQLTQRTRYAGRGDGEVTKMGAGESYRPAARPRSPRSDTSRFDRDRDRSPLRRDRPRSPMRERARSPPFSTDTYHPGGRDRSPPRRRSRSPISYRSRDRTPPRDLPNWRDRDRGRSPIRNRSPPRARSPARQRSPVRSRSPFRARSPGRPRSPVRPRSPPRRFSPRRDDDRRPRSPRRPEVDNRDIRRRSRSPYDRNRVPPRARSPMRSPPAGPRGGGWRPRSRSPPRRDDRILNGPSSLTWRRPRSPSPSADRSSGRASEQSSRRPSPRPSYRPAPPLDERPSTRSPYPRERSPLRDSKRSTPRERSPVRAASPKSRSPPPPSRSPPRGPAQPFRAPTGPSANRNFNAPVRSPPPPRQTTPLSMSAHNRPENAAPVAPPSGPRAYIPPPVRGGFVPRGGRGSFSDRRPEPSWGLAPSRPAPAPSPTPPAHTPTAPAAIPTGPRASSTVAEWKAPPTSRSSSISSVQFHTQHAKVFTPTQPRVHPAMANITPIIPGGKIDPTYSGISKELEARMKKNEEDLERMREDLHMKEEKLRKGLRGWEKLERESAALGLKAELSERHVRMLAGEGVGGAAF